MTVPSARPASAFPSSPYAAELERGAAGSAFSPPLEAEYLHAHLASNRTLIRVACALAAFVCTLRALEQMLLVSWDALDSVNVGIVVGSSLLLAVLTWTPAFGRMYLPIAQVVVPIRNCIGAALAIEVAARGHLEMLMVLPLMAIGPFFFLGLKFRVAALTVALTIVTFVVACTVFGLALPVALRTGVLLAMAAVGCGIAALHIERTSRRSFLEGRLIAELAQHDALTGLKNRRVFDEHLGRVWDQAIEDQRLLAILLVDVDKFKDYNDGYGHQAGDHALRRVAQTLQTFVARPFDVLARYGGEEFIALLPNTGRDGAEQAARRLITGIRESPARVNGEELPLTISIGGAVLGLREEPRDLLARADAALYQAKSEGRDRYVFNWLSFAGLS